MLIGIDLGTTNSLVACFRNGKAEIIPNRLGENFTPSVVSVDDKGTVYVGRSAKERAMLYPLQSADVFKRSMGTEREYQLGDWKLRAEELSSLVLRSLKEDAEAYLDERITDAIIRPLVHPEESPRQCKPMMLVLKSASIFTRLE